VVASARALLERARGQGGHCYADQDFSPISELDVEILAHRFGARIRVAPLPDEIQELAVPGIAGPHTLRINRDLPPAFRRLAMRHGLAHVIAGELEGDHDGGPRFLSSFQDWMSLEERRADLFALADLIPDRLLEAVVGAHSSPLSALWWMASQVQQFVPGWGKDRVEDRARLRWELYFESPGVSP